MEFAITMIILAAFFGWSQTLKDVVKVYAEVAAWAIVLLFAFIKIPLPFNIMTCFFIAFFALRSLFFSR